MRHRPYLPLVWLIRSYDPYNRIGKHALQDIYSWRDQGRLRADPICGRRPAEDVIVVRRIDSETTTTHYDDHTILQVSRVPYS